ncbi:hypothetical protein [Comamonas sp.]|uniref:hypothetical protein n=1 Tax=Comamonas sp. TaxID=34028 RepID=UPI003D121DF7
MNLNIKFPNDLFAVETIQLSDIPCVCKVTFSGDFQVVFSELLFEASGFMSDFDKKEIDLRFPVFAGGPVAQHCNAMITLGHADGNKYQVANLKFFHGLSGWISLIEHCDFVPIDESKYEGY